MIILPRCKTRYSMATPDIPVCLSGHKKTAGKSGCFRKASEFNRHLSGTLNLENRFRQAVVPDECFVGGIIKNEGFIFPCKINPCFKLRFGDGGPSGIVGKAKIDQIHSFCWQIRDKAVLASLDSRLELKDRHPGEQKN